MPITKTQQIKILGLKKVFEKLRKGKGALLQIIDEAELPENVYNSNAIENSTLTLKETERILLEMEVSRNVSLREVFEAKNLARVSEYIRNLVSRQRLDENLILLLHRMLIQNIKDSIAGRFRQKGEYVRVGTHIAPAPEHVERLLEQALIQYYSNYSGDLIEKLALFHLEFEHIHPFVDGNGRIGRVLLNYLLQESGFPPIIIRNKEKDDYYDALKNYDDKGETEAMEKIIYLAITESLHKRLAYLKGTKITTLAEYSRSEKQSLPTLSNAAKRQTIPAFREKGVWKIAK